MKKILFVLAILFSMAMIPKAYAYNFQSGGIYYDITSNTMPYKVAVTNAGSYNSYSGNVTIPSTVNHDGHTYTVTAIGNSAFSGCGNLTGITIPNTIINIGEYAFASCSQLHEIIIPNSVITIGSEAFASCGISSITIPNSVKSIGWYAFENTGPLTVVFNADSCEDMMYAFVTNLVSLTIGNNVKYIPPYAFAGHSELSIALVIGNSVENIGEFAFYNCTGLTSMTFGNSLVSIGDGAFCGCTGLSGTLTIPNSVAYIGYNAFWGCNHLTGSLIIPNLVTHISDGAFNGCTGFTGTLTIPNGVTYIGSSAFYQCTGLTGTLTIPNAVKRIGGSAFYNCSGLTGDLEIPNSVTYIGDHAFYQNGFSSVTIGQSVDSIREKAFARGIFTSLYFNADSCTFMGANVFENCNNFTLSFGNNVKQIPSNAFENCSSLTGSLIISNNVTYIGDYAFSGCSNLTGTLTIPDKVTHIGNYAFMNCPGFSSLIIGKAVASIGTLAFACYGLTSVVFGADSCTNTPQQAFYTAQSSLTINNNVKYLPNYAFRNWNGLFSVFFNADSCISAQNIFSKCSNLTSLSIGNNVKCIPAYTFSYCSGIIDSLIIPNSVKSIGLGAFRSCHGLTGALIIPDSVSFIGADAFSYCDGLTSLSIGTALSSISAYTFHGCDGLTGTLEIPNTVKNIGTSAFSSCSGLASISMGDSVSFIGDGAFSGCNGLTGTLVIPSSVTYIGNSAFDDCYGLTGTLVFPNSVSYIGEGAFSNCSGLTGNLVIPSSVTAIGYNTFYNCSGFSSLSISDSVSSIGDFAFANCNGLTHLTIGKSVSSIGIGAFYDCFGLTSINVLNETPPTIAFDSLSYINFFTFDSVNRDIPVYVPCGSAQDYRIIWRNLSIDSVSYFNNIQETPAYQLNVSTVDTSQGYVLISSEPSCDSAAEIIAFANPYNIFSHWSDGNTENPRSLMLTQDTILVAYFESCSTIIQYDTISACESYSWNDSIYLISGDFTQTFTNVAGCDSIVTLHLTINHSVTESVEATACDSFSWNDSIYTQSGEFTQTLTTANGCDSVVTLHLTITNTDYTDYTDGACDSYTWNGETYTQSGNYTQTFTNATGCDSVVTLHLTVNASDHTELTAAACGQYVWLDSTYTESGNYSVTYTNMAGCDSVVTLHLTINPIPEVAITGSTTICPGGGTILTATGADSYLWSNYSSNASIPVNMFGVYSVTGTTSAGCFNSASVTVLVAQPPVITITGDMELCSGNTGTITAHGGTSYMWSNGSTDSSMTVNTASSWQVIGYDENGCNSMASATVTVWQPATSNLFITSFDSCYTWFGTPYCQSGDYTHTLQTIHGCDSVITLHLTLEEAIITEFNATGCDNYTWNGITYSQSGNYIQNFTAANGNDSIVTLHLTITNTDYTDYTDAACESYTWNGETYTQSGNYTQTFTNSAGCDSVVTLHLTIHQPTTSDTSAVACESFTWYGTTYTFSGSYHAYLTNAAGCDSIVTLHLTITNTDHTDYTDIACESYTWNGETYTVSGNYTQTFTNSAGCDSIVTLHLTINQPTTGDTAAVVCETFTWHGNTYTQSGDYTYSTTNVAGCDSVVTLHLTVMADFVPQIAVSGTLTACGNETVTLSLAGTYQDYLWSTGDTTASITVGTAGYYWVTIGDGNGCTTVSEPVHLGVSESVSETPALCMVGVVGNHNMVIWEELTDPDVVGYQLYRENGQANVFEPLTFVPAGIVNAYEDITADPSIRAYRYKITAVDTCGGETPMSEYHKTVHLTINQGLGNSYNLIWTPYEGFEFASYRLYRGTANNNLQLIQTMPSTLTSYTDNNPSSNALFYQIEVVMNGSCVQHTRDITFTGARSNIVYNGTPITTDVSVSACDSYDWNGQHLTTSGDYTQSFTSLLGYDSVVTLHLTINSSTYSEFSIVTEDHCYI